MVVDGQTRHCELLCFYVDRWAYLYSINDHGCGRGDLNIGRQSESHGRRRRDCALRIEVNLEIGFFVQLLVYLLYFLDRDGSWQRV